MLRVLCWLLLVAGGCVRGATGPATHGDLLEIEFPGFHGDGAPARAPLLQQVCFRFSAAPDARDISARTLPVVDAAGVAVPGHYRVRGCTVTYTPALPTSVGVDASGTPDAGNAALRPGCTYRIQVSPRDSAFVRRIAPDLVLRFPHPRDPGGVSLAFSTTTDPGRFFQGLPRRRPALVKTSPVDGATGFSPFLYEDPEHRFPPPRAIELTFDGPVHPHPWNVGEQALQLLDGEAGPGAGRELALGILAELVANEPERAVLRIVPSGILPLGHLLRLEIPHPVRGLHETLRGLPAERATVLAFTTAPAGSPPVRDLLREDFDEAAREDRAPHGLEPGTSRARWDVADSGVLQPAEPADFSGSLGRFVPVAVLPQVLEIALDTDRQVFPLLDGSTPDVGERTEVVGGVFSFTDVDVPEGVVLVPRGSRPLVLAASGTIRIAGTILASGGAGQAENAFDSATSAVPGGRAGCGGGRGGEGHPVVTRPGGSPPAALVSPVRGGRGLGPGGEGRSGGDGGTCGMLDLPDFQGAYGTDCEIDARETVDAHNNGFRPPGGGGGSFLFPGETSRRAGWGNVRADGQGRYLLRTPADGPGFDVLPPGEAGALPFTDGNPDNDFFGSTGEWPTLFGGQGGGAGGSALDSYFNGAWCRQDGDPGNDALCNAEFGLPPAVADSVGDSRGGGGGGGGGAVELRALGSITLASTARVLCHGGDGAGGEALGCSNWGGSGGGGSGGATVLHSATSVTVEAGALLDVAGGRGAPADRSKGYVPRCQSLSLDTAGAGGAGGTGMLSFRTPAGTLSRVDPGAVLTAGAWVDSGNVLNPADLGARSAAVSRWYDLGRAIARSPRGQRPSFRFRGLDARGRIRTDAEGWVVDPARTDVHVGYLGELDPGHPGRYLPGREPRDHYVPPGAEATIEFQGARAIVEGSREIDPATITPWTPRVDALNGMQFLRYRVTFDLAADPVAPPWPQPTVQSLAVSVEF